MEFNCIFRTQCKTFRSRKLGDIWIYIFVNVYIKEQVVRFVLDLSLMMIMILCLAHPGPRLNPVLEVSSVSGISLNLL